MMGRRPPIALKLAEKRAFAQLIAARGVTTNSSFMSTWSRARVSDFAACDQGPLPLPQQQK